MKVPVLAIDLFAVSGIGLYVLGGKGHLNSFHHKKKPVRTVGELDETIFVVELEDGSIFCIHYYSHRSDLAALH